MERVDNAREESLKLLIKVFNQGSYSNILIKNLNEKFSPLDRAFITEIVYGTVKWKLRIDYIISQISSIKIKKISPAVLNILRLGIYQIDFMDKVPQSAAVDECVKLAKKHGNPGAAKFVNAVLRNYIRNRNSMTYPDKVKDTVKFLSVYYSFPEWIVMRLLDELGLEFVESFLRCSNDIPPLSIRVNRLKTDKTNLIQSLAEKGIDVQDGLYMEDALSIKGVPGISSLDEFKKGMFIVQDESSMLAVRILDPKPGEFIMDVCSAPGTKSTYIAELMGNKGIVFSGDVKENKLSLVKENAERLGINIIETNLQDAAKFVESYADKADRVLIDAPCSGLGIMRKKPEIRWNREASDISQIQTIQKSIINTCSRYVKPGGVLVYSTCTVLREENIELVNSFISENSDFRFENITDLVPQKLVKETCSNGYIELFPNVDNIDGFFIAKLRRVK